jgi:hypothetical protein
MRLPPSWVSGMGSAQDPISADTVWFVIVENKPYEIARIPDRVSMLSLNPPPVDWGKVAQDVLEHKTSTSRFTLYDSVVVTCRSDVGGVVENCCFELRLDYYSHITGAGVWQIFVPASLERAHRARIVELCEWLVINNFSFTRQESPMAIAKEDDP